MIAIGMMVAIAVLVASFRTTVVAWAGETLRADLFVRPLGLARRVGRRPFFAVTSPSASRRSPGVAEVDTFRASSAVSRPAHERRRDRPRDPRRAHRHLRLLGGARSAALARALPPDDEVLVSEPFATKFGVATGRSRSRCRRRRARCAPRRGGLQRLLLRCGIVLIDVRTYRRLFHDDSSTRSRSTRRPAPTCTRLRTAIVRARRAAARSTSRRIASCARSSCEIFDRTFAITYALDVIAIAIAVLGVVSTLFALVLERRREFGLLRYLGVTTRRRARDGAGRGGRNRVPRRRARRRGRDAARAAAGLRHQPPGVRVADRAARPVVVSGRDRRCSSSPRRWWRACIRRGVAARIRTADAVRTESGA